MISIYKENGYIVHNGKEKDSPEVSLVTEHSIFTANTSERAIDLLLKSGDDSTLKEIRRKDG